jgi:hypothetical protein
MEEWKLCGESSYCKYFINNKGDVKSITKKGKKERLLKPWICKGTEYYMITISKVKITVHSLVALCFIGTRPKGMVIDHINRIRTDNRVENLRYCSQQDNLINSSRFKTDINEKDPKVRKKITNKLWRDNMDKEKERERCRKKYKEKYSKKYTCECGVTLTIGKKTQHEKTKSHIKKLNSIV